MKRVKFSFIAYRFERVQTHESERMGNVEENNSESILKELEQSGSNSVDANEDTAKKCIRMYRLWKAARAML